MSRASVAEARLTGWRAGLVWLVASASMVGVAVAQAIAPAAPDEPFVLAWALGLFVAALACTGALIATRQPRNAIGWILVVAAVVATCTTAFETYVTMSLGSYGGALPGTAWLGWLLGFFFMPVVGAVLVVVPLIFPDGRLLSQRWRWVVWLAVLVGAMLVFESAFRPGPMDAGGLLQNPVGIDLISDISDGLETLAFGGLVVVIGSAIISMVLRFRRGTRRERQQLKWFVAAVSLTGACVAIAFLPLGPLSSLFWPAWLLSLPLVPIAIGLAVLRYRLYEIDRIISRSVSWAVVTGVLVAAFAAGVVGLQALLAGFTQGETLAVAASTLVVFALFQPLRRRVQAVVDRRFDRARYDGQKVVDAFAMRLRDEVDLDRLRTALVATADDIVRPVDASIWLRSRETGR